ncbi:MAG: copper transporter [Sporichthyaceae bacterium]
MIDFRYHLVSLVAVFMALATGILVGSSLLNQSLIDSQRSTISSQNTEKDTLRRAVDSARDQISYRDEFLSTLDEELIGAQLVGQRVVLVSTPGASGGDTNALEDTLRAAGAQITGRVGINDDFFAADEDPREFAVRGEVRDAIVRRRPLAGVVAGADVAIADAHLAAALLSRSPIPGMVGGAKVMLDDLERGGFIEVGDVDTAADLAVVLVGPPPDEALSETDRTRRGLVGLAAALDAAGTGAVVVGPLSAAVGGALDGIRDGAQTADTVSTVDTVDSVFGRVATALALVEQVNGGAGHYGSNADSPLPELRGPDPRAPDPRAPDPRAPDPRAPDPRTPVPKR